MVFEIKDKKKIRALFEGWQETMIWSCLQDIMGKAYALSQESPASAMIQVGDFCFFAGTPDEELLTFWLTDSDREFLIMTPGSQDWEPVIENFYKDRARKTKRYAIKKEMDVFDREKLQKIVDNLSAEYELRWIDGEIYSKCKEFAWSRDLVSQYDTYEIYEKLGLGVAVLKDGEPVAGASSYSSFEKGIEIEIDTKEEHRRKGLATVCGAKLILECLKRGWYPSWDAQNRWSVALAEKLGYHFDGEYTVYEVFLK